MHFCSTPLGENTWKLRTFLWTLPHAPFPFADLNLYPFAAISHNLGYNKNKQTQRQGSGHPTQAISQDCVPSKQP